MSLLQDSWPRDGGAWAFHISAEASLKRLVSWVDPFAGRASSCSEEPYFDTDLYAIHTLILTSTIHLHFDNMSLKFSKAANELLELINFLHSEDYRYLDPVLAVGTRYPLVTSRLVANIFFRDIDLLVLRYHRVPPYYEHQYHRQQRINVPIYRRLPLPSYRYPTDSTEEHEPSCPSSRLGSSLID